MSPTPTSRKEYLDLVHDVASRSTEAVRTDPVAVASSLVAGVDKDVDPKNGYTITHGTDEYQRTTLYPTDVVMCSNQPQTRVDHRYAEDRTDAVHESGMEVYAIYTLALDLLDAAEGQPVPA